ncbi:MAG: hypothetical protein ABJ327_17940 [Litoreibacter sp.]
MKNQEQTKLTKLPTNVRFIMRRPDLPQSREPVSFEVNRDGVMPFVVTLEKRQRQVIEALMLTPLYCASPVRLSDVVHIVKREHGLDIETMFFSDETGPETATFGVYVLKDKLRRVENNEVAA